MAVILVGSAQVNVPTAATAVRLVSADVSGIVAVILSVPAGNTGSMFVGGPDVSATIGMILLKGVTPFVINAPEGQILDIRNMWICATVDNDKINVSYLKKVN